MFIIYEHIKTMNKSRANIMKIREQNVEKDILEKALDAFKKMINLKATIHQNQYGENAELLFWQEDKKWVFAVDVQKNITRTLIGVIHHQRLLNRQQVDRIIVTKYVNPRIADLMKQDDICFIDTAGNAYINKPPLFIFIKGNKIPEEDRLKPTTRAFRPAGLQVIFALLCKKGLENMTYREIAKNADVALGTVGWVLGELRRMGYVNEMGKRGRRLNDTYNLFIRWVNAYPEELKPKRLIGRYRADNFYWWKDAELEEYQAYWGGEVAANMLTRYLKPEKITIYTRQPLGDLMLKNKIRKDPKGDIEVFEVFWKFEYEWNYKNLVPPILIYADLMDKGDKRNIETADIIYEQTIDQLIGKD
jgi:hypothetical protein